MFKTTFNATNVGTKLIPNTWLKKQQQKKMIQSIMFKYSKKVLTVDMINGLNCSLNFCILPIKIDITKNIWSEICQGKETTEEEKNIFKTMKNY